MSEETLKKLPTLDFVLLVPRATGCVRCNENLCVAVVSHSRNTAVVFHEDTSAHKSPFDALCIKRRIVCGGVLVASSPQEQDSKTSNSL